MGRDFYTSVLRPASQLMADHFETLMDKGLNEGEILEKRLLNAITEPDPGEIRCLATAATDAFLKIYGQQPAPIGIKAEQQA